MEIKRTVAERNTSQTAVSPSVLPQVKRLRHLQAEHRRVKVYNNNSNNNNNNNNNLIKLLEKAFQLNLQCEISKT